MKQDFVYKKLLTLLSGKALMLHRDYLSVLVSFLPGSDLSVNMPPLSLAANYQDLKKDDLQKLRINNGTACIPVRGIILQRYDWILSRFLNVSFYEIIQAQFQKALSNPNVKRITLEVDSPGGEICGCFDLADEIYNARGIKPISAVVNEVAYSAAYLLTSSAEKIFIPRTGSAGSVGVIMGHINQSKYNEELGVKYTPIFAGSHKNDFDRNSPMSPEMMQTAKGIVNSHYELLIKTVARNRGMSPQAVRDTEAALYYGKSAVDVGLADQVTPYIKALKTIEQ